jgi:hypothetical protein
MVRLVQLAHRNAGRRVARVDEPHLRLFSGCASIYELAQMALESKQSMYALVDRLASDDQLAYDEVYRGESDWRLLAPIDHPEPSRCFVTGTGLTHKGSAENRQSMHEAEPSEELRAKGKERASPLHAPGARLPALSDSMKMFEIGLEGGRPADGCVGASPEWFYKGIGTIVRAHNEALAVPSHGFDGGEEAEIAGVYIVGPQGAPYRVGLAQGNEFSDHVWEAKNYLYLAQSKLRDCALGPELVLDPQFDDVHGFVAIERGGKVIWQAPQASGECHMCHSLANLEHHHFKHAEHRRPGDVHIHFFGADMFSFKDRLRLEDGDEMVISFEGFGRPLRNKIRIENGPEEYVAVQRL